MRGDRKYGDDLIELVEERSAPLPARRREGPIPPGEPINAVSDTALIGERGELGTLASVGLPGSKLLADI